MHSDRTHVQGVWADLSTLQHGSEPLPEMRVQQVRQATQGNQADREGDSEVDRDKGTMDNPESPALEVLLTHKPTLPNRPGLRDYYPRPRCSQGFFTESEERPKESKTGLRPVQPTEGEPETEKHRGVQ